MSITLNPNREKSLLRRHPWIFASAIRHVDETHVSGSTVDLLSSEGQFLARASYSPNSQIRARVRLFFDDWGTYKRTFGELRDFAEAHRDCRIVFTHSPELVEL